MFTRYIPDRAYASADEAKAAALALRDEVLAECAKRPAKEVLEEYRLKYLRNKPADKAEKSEKVESKESEGKPAEAATPENA